MLEIGTAAEPPEKWMSEVRGWRLETSSGHNREQAESTDMVDLRWKQQSVIFKVVTHHAFSGQSHKRKLKS